MAWGMGLSNYLDPLNSVSGIDGIGISRNQYISYTI